MPDAQYREFKTVKRAPVDPLVEQLHYSFRRYYIDEFYFRHVPSLKEGSHILDLGGTKFLKRGQFDIEQYHLDVCYMNLLTDKTPDVQGDAAAIPFQESCFDAVICAELLELVPEPLRVLREVYRVLKPGGVLLISIPFLYRVQFHPYDYGRYTHLWWGENLSHLGFAQITIEWQGFFASVLMEMLRDWVAHKGGMSSKPLRKLLKQIGGRLVKWGRRKALIWDARVAMRQDSFADWYCSYSSGFGIRAVKT